jgi:hypothetical protein
VRALIWRAERAAMQKSPSGALGARQGRA